MRLLDRYLLRELLLPVTYCLSAFMTFWMAFSLLGKLDDFREQNLQLLDIIEYILVTAPEQLFVVLPVALLLGSLYALANHSKGHEITAMRAAGIGLFRIGVPYYLVGFICSGFVLVLNEWWLPDSNARAEDVLHRYDTNKLARLMPVVFRTGAAQRTWNGYFNLQTEQLFLPQIHWTLTNGVQRQIYADRAEYRNGGWYFTNAVLMEKTPGQLYPVQYLTNQLMVTDLNETPDLIRSEVKVSSLSNIQAAKRAQLSVRDIIGYLKLHPDLSKEQRRKVMTQLHARLALPWSSVLVMLIALPLGALSGRRNVFVGVASSIFICFGFFILQRLGLSLGVGGVLPAWLAAWLPNILFGGTGLYLTATAR